jgi:predicted permease
VIAHRELSALATRFNTEGNEPTWLGKYTDLRLSPLTGLPPDATGPLGGFLGVLLGAATLVLLIASINVGAMLSARAIARRREMAIRAALGAASGRLVRQLLTEILLLFGVGAVGGMVLAIVGTAALERMPIPAEITFAPELSPDARVFGFALAISLLTGFVVGLSPARRATRLDVVVQLRDGSVGGSARRTWLGNALVVGQLATSLLLLVGVGLFLRALQQASRIDPGFDANGVTAAQFDAESWGYDEAKARAFFRELRGRVERLPGVTTVSYTTILPLTLRSNVEEMQFEGQGDRKFPLHFLQVDDGYLTALRIPLVIGRDIAFTDNERAPRVAVVNEAFGRRFAEGKNLLGRAIRFHGEPVTIVGVARDAKLESLGEAVPPRVYFPLAQQWESKRALLVRGGGDPRTLASAIQAAVHDIDESAPRPAVIPLRRAMAIGLMPQRIAASVTGMLGLIGLVLATIGLYGIIAHSTSRRGREIGIRLALGARRADVSRMILREGMRLTAAGIVTGLLLAAAASRVVASLLFGVSPLDAITFGGTALLLATVALVASWLPARRAAAADPMVVLRAE